VVELWRPSLGRQKKKDRGKNLKMAVKFAWERARHLGGGYVQGVELKDLVIAPNKYGGKTESAVWPKTRSDGPQREKVV